MTTAEARKAAADAAASLEWAEAARLWEYAADNYPRPGGALARADIAAMRRKAESARRMADA